MQGWSWKSARTSVGVAVVLLGAACGGPRAAARSLFVDGAFTGAGTGAQDAPFATISQATAASAPGDTIIVGDGVYKETVVPKSGTPGRDITYRAAHRWGARIVGVRDDGCFSFCGAGNGSRYDADTPGQRYVAVDGFDLDNPNADGYAYGVKANQADHIRITDCRIHGCGGNGIGACYCDYMDVERNVVYDNATNSVLGPSGISLWKTVPSDRAPGFHNVVSGNLVYDNRETGSNHTDGNGIIIDSTARDLGTVVENNVVFDNGGAGIALDGSAHCTVRFNTLFEDGADGATHYAEVRLDTVTWEAGTPYNAPCADCAVYGNILYAQPGRNALKIAPASVRCEADHNLRFGTAPGDTVGRGDLTGDPLFVRADIHPEYADFHLQPASPARKAARAGERTLHDTDRDGRRRSQPTSLGAYQWRPPSPVRPSGQKKP